jgi:hypothetical protein
VHRSPAEIPAETTSNAASFTAGRLIASPTAGPTAAPADRSGRTGGDPSPDLAVGPSSGALPTHPCDGCGRHADFEIARLWLCVDCYHTAGSTCAGVRTPERAADPVC